MKNWNVFDRQVESLPNSLSAQKKMIERKKKVFCFWFINNLEFITFFFQIYTSLLRQSFLIPV